MQEKAAIKLILSRRTDLLGYVWSIVRDEHLAEDVFQDVVLIVLGKLDEINDEDHLIRWLRVALRLESLKALRRRRSQPASMEPGLLEALEEAWDAELLSEHSEVKQLLSRCLDRLTPKARLLVEARYVQGLTGQPLAERLGRSVNAVYVGLSRAHRSLAECMRQSLGAEGEATP